MKKQISGILNEMTNEQLTAIYLSLEDGNPLRKKVHRIVFDRNCTIRGVRRYHGLKNN